MPDITIICCIPYNEKWTVTIESTRGLILRLCALLCIRGATVPQALFSENIDPCIHMPEITYARHVYAFVCAPEVTTFRACSLLTTWYHRGRVREAAGWIPMKEGIALYLLRPESAIICYFSLNVN